jgi:AraC-like DNA-binding protein
MKGIPERAPDFAVYSTPLPLRPYISHCVGFRARGIAPSTHTGLPSHHIVLAISLEKPIGLVRTVGTQRCAASLQAFVSGLHLGPTAIRYDTSRDGVFIHLTPAGVRAVLGVTSIELASRIVDFRDIWGRPAQHLIDRLMDAPTWRERFSILDRVFLQALDPVPPSAELTLAWRRLAQENGCIRVHELAAEVGWSRQHLRERFHRAFGLPPKEVARIFRFEHSFRLIQERQYTLAEIAAICGYYDQAHMILDWKELAGRTPREWIANELPFFQYATPSGSDDGCSGGSTDPQ